MVTHEDMYNIEPWMKDAQIVHSVLSRCRWYTKTKEIDTEQEKWNNELKNRIEHHINQELNEDEDPPQDNAMWIYMGSYTSMSKHVVFAQNHAKK